MKKTIFSLFFIICATYSFAYDVEVDGIYYNIIEKAKIAEVTYKGKTPRDAISYSGSVTIPPKISVSGTEYPVTSIGENAFFICSGLTSVTIPNSVTSIGTRAFQECTSLTSVTIPNSVNNIGASAFYGCSSLTSLVVEENNPNYSSADNVLFNKAKTNLIYCAVGKKGEYSIPNSVTKIEAYAFYNYSSITSIVIPNSVNSIGEWAFSGCSGLTSMIIPNSVTHIGSYTFVACI